MNFFGFSQGATRWVILIGPFAVKIARIRPFYWFERLLVRRQEGLARERLGRYHRNIVIAVLKYLLIGIISNLDEYRVWKEFRDLPLAPTLFTLFGFVNIQLRGVPIDAYDERTCPFDEVARLHPEITDLKATYHFCRIDGTIVLIDYAHETGAAITGYYRRPEIVFA